MDERGSKVEPERFRSVSRLLGNHGGTWYLLYMQTYKTVVTVCDASLKLITNFITMAYLCDLYC